MPYMISMPPLPPETEPPVLPQSLSVIFVNVKERKYVVLEDPAVWTTSVGADCTEVSTEQLSLLSRKYWISKTPALKATVAVPTVEDAKSAKVSRINQNTDDIIKGGFTFSGALFSASPVAQTSYLGMMVSRDALTYPIIISTIDDQASVALADAASVVSFYSACLSFIAEARTSGSMLKQQVADCTTLDGISLIVDDRT